MGDADPSLSSSSGSTCSTPSGNNNHISIGGPACPGSQDQCSRYVRRASLVRSCVHADRSAVLRSVHHSFEHQIPKIEPDGGPGTPPTPPTSSCGDGPELKVAVCAGCQHRITDRFYLQAVDRRWHASCLQCCQCRNTLDGEITCFSRDGNIYCKKDYYR